MQVKVDGKRNITLDFEAPKKFKLLQDGKEIPYLRTGKNSFRLSRNIDGVLDLEEIIEQPKIVKPMQLQTQQMALVNPNDVLMINQAAQQLEVEQNILGETQKRVEQTQAYLDVQQQRINETVLSVQGLETSNAERITATENGLFNLAGNLAKTEQNLVDGIEIVNNGLQEHKSAENPHGITKETIGLDKVNNTSDIDKPISKAVQNALDEKADKDEIQAIRDELGEYQEKNDRITNALSSYTGGLAYSGSDIIIDDMLSTESENPVQNKVITNALNEKANISDIPTVNNATLTIQKNGTSAGTFSANASEDVNINLIIPTTASDVSALPDSTKYGAGLSLTINSTNYVMTAQLKDQDGNNLGTAQTIDLPLESVVVSGSYDSVNKKIVLTLQNGTTIDIPVGDLISGLQTEITVNNKLNADLVDDSTSTNKFVTASDITTWNGKQDTLTAGTNITIENNVISSTAQESFFRGNFSTWENVPTDTSLYQEDIHGNRIPQNTDFIIVEDASQFVPSGSLMHKLVVENLAATEAFTIRITDENGVSQKYYWENYNRVFVAIDDYYSLKYQPGAPGIWYIKTNDGSPIILKGVIYQSGEAQLCLTTDPATPFDAGMPSSAGQYQGAWRFAYYGTWSTDGKVGWTPQYNIENTLPIANETTFGIAKLYTTTGQNTDGSMTQKSITDALSGKQDVISDLATIRSGASAGATAVQPGDLATVATSGDYDDLINKPTIPTDTSDLTNGAGFITGITSSDVTTALGYTPYNSTNPNGYITSSALSGYATETWVGNQGYITGITSGDVTTALGYTPYDASNPSGYITGITSGDVTTALGYTPYDSSNPNGYTSNVGTVTSVNNTSPDGNGNVTLSIPTVNDSTITLTQGGVTKGSFTLNQASGATIALDAGGGGSSYTAGTGIDITNNVISVTGPTLINKSTQNSSYILTNYSSGLTTTVTSAVAMGYGSEAKSNNAVVIGANTAVASNVSGSGMTSVGCRSFVYGEGSVALGYRATVNNAAYAIQLGYGTNSEANSLYVATSSSDNWKLLGSDGLIPAGRIPISTSVDSTSTNNTVVGAKLFYDTCGDIETLINAL